MASDTRDDDKCVTIEAIEQDQENAINLLLPPDASKELLQAVIEAASGIADSSYGASHYGEAEKYFDNLYINATNRRGEAISQLDALRLPLNESMAATEPAVRENQLRAATLLHQDDVAVELEPEVMREGWD